MIQIETCDGHCATMTNKVADFGSRSRFHIRFQWLSDHDPIDRRPASHGWSMGKLELTVANRNLMEHNLGDHRQGDLCWYFGPMFHWFAENWIPLFHEEHFTWRERSCDASAAACEQAMASTFGGVSAAAAQRWCFRHGLSSADAGGPVPDLFLRRFSDDVELCWTGTASPIAPDGFTFVSGPGRIRLPVESVACPLRDMLQWVKDNPPALCRGSFREVHHRLASKIEGLSSVETDRFRRADIPEALCRRVEGVFRNAGRPGLLDPVMHDSVPFVVLRSPAAALTSTFPWLTQRNPGRSRCSRRIGGTGSRLQDLVGNAALVGKPWQDGYHLAEDLLDDPEELEFDMLPDGRMSITGFCCEFGMEVVDRKLDADSIRGVALARAEPTSTKVVNESSPATKTERAGDLPSRTNFAMSCTIKAGRKGLPASAVRGHIPPWSNGQMHLPPGY